jgi:lysine 2,3-aminomutase
MEAARSWVNELKHNLRTEEDLYQWGFISEEDRPLYRPVLKQYLFSLPRYYANLIDKKDPLCPIRLQAIPSPTELKASPDYFRDPLKDLIHQPVKGITHRYPNRALLHLTSNCSMYCRFCFRKTLLNEDKAQFFSADIKPALSYLSSHSEIEEVIFSGGDPFLANELVLQECLNHLNKLPHLKRIRFHTRVPVTFPERIDLPFTKILSSSRLPIIVVTHFNHPKEITGEAKIACEKLKSICHLLLNQSVLLRGVNDNPKILSELSEKLFEAQILPYYLHHPDKSEGTLTFDVSVKEGIKIWNELKKNLPGYLVPKYVKDDTELPYKSDVVGLSTES